MAKILIRDYSFKEDTIQVISQMNQILNSYKGRMSVRQIFYQYVRRNWIQNTQEQYDRIQSIATKARYAGMVDWDAIEDRLRRAKRPKEFESGESALRGLYENFRLDRWVDQPFYVECWIEKDALSGILVPISNTFHVTMMVNRGYSSASSMKDSADRIRDRCQPNERRPHPARPVVIYMGDHDPSGEDMVRDIRERLTEFGCPKWLDVRKLALTMEQVEKYKCPPNPLKTVTPKMKSWSGVRGRLSDSRAAEYVEKHGTESWELDALPPDVLEDMLADVVKSYIDKEKMDAVISRENKIKTALKKVAATLE